MYVDVPELTKTRCFWNDASNVKVCVRVARYIACANLCNVNEIGCLTRCYPYVPRGFKNMDFCGLKFYFASSLSW